MSSSTSNTSIILTCRVAAVSRQIGHNRLSRAPRGADGHRARSALGSLEGGVSARATSATQQEQRQEQRHEQQEQMIVLTAAARTGRRLK